MFVTQAVIEIAIARFKEHQESNSWINKDKLLKTMKQAAQNLLSVPSTVSLNSLESGA